MDIVAAQHVWTGQGHHEAYHSSMVELNNLVHCTCIHELYLQLYSTCTLHVALVGVCYWLVSNIMTTWLAALVSLCLLVHCPLQWRAISTSLLF